MSLKETAQPALNMLGGGLSKLAAYWWVLFIFVGIAIAIGIVVIVKMMRDKKKQWTHTLVVRRVLQNHLLSKPHTIRMRRFPLIKRAEVFELETALLGGYLMPELDSYSDVNEYSIILDNNNRIYTNKGEFFNPDKSSVNVSAKHAEIDISRNDLRADYQGINAASKRIEWTAIAKMAMWTVFIVAVMIVSIVALGKWGDSYDARVEVAKQQTQAFDNIATALETSQATANTQVLILQLLKELYGTNNIQGKIQEFNNGSVSK